MPLDWSHVGLAMAFLPLEPTMRDVSVVRLDKPSESNELARWEKGPGWTHPPIGLITGQGL